MREKTLAGVFAQDLDNSTTISKRVFVPLKVPGSVFEHGAQLVALQLVW